MPGSQAMLSKRLLNEAMALGRFCPRPDILPQGGRDRRGHLQVLLSLGLSGSKSSSGEPAQHVAAFSAPVGQLIESKKEGAGRNPLQAAVSALGGEERGQCPETGLLRPA